MILNLAAFRSIKPVLEFTRGANSATAKERILEAITKAKSITAPELMIATGMLSGNAYRTLAALEVDGLIKRSEKSCTAGEPVHFSLINKLA